MKNTFINGTGDPRREALVRRIEEVYPNVPVRKLVFAMREELLRRKGARLARRLKEQGL